jgi:hypothetical protein
MGVYGNYDREKRNRTHERGMDRWNRRTEKTDRIYEKIGLFHGICMNKEYVWKIKN